MKTEDHSFKFERLDFINETEDIGPDSPVLVCSHRHLFYYHSKKRGIDYRDPKMNAFYAQSDKEAALDILTDKLNVRYIFTNWNFQPVGILQNIIDSDCDLILEDGNGYLYKIEETDRVH